jgi:hypothetical protein
MNFGQGSLRVYSESRWLYVTRADGAARSTETQPTGRNTATAGSLRSAKLRSHGGYRVPADTGRR